MTLHFIINPKYKPLQRVVARIPLVFDREGEMVHDGRNTIKMMTLPDGTRVNVKRYHRPAGLNRLVYSWGLRKPKCERAYEYPQRLLRQGIDTPEPVACLEERGWLWLLGYSYLVTVQCDYGHTLYEMGDATPDQYLPLAKALAAFAANMHAKGILHKDFTPGNILWKRDGKGYHFSLVDTNRMSFGAVSLHTGLRNMCRLWGPKGFLIALARNYALARQADPEAAEEYMLKERRKFWSDAKKRRKANFDIEL